MAPAARRARHPRRPDARPRRGPRARPGLPVVAGPRRSRRTPRHRRPPARAAPRRHARQPLRRRWPRRRRRWPAQRQVHAAAHDREQPRADHDAQRVAVLRPGLRRRHLRADDRAAARLRCRHALRAGRRTPGRGRGAGHRRPPRGLLPAAGHRLDRDLPCPSQAGHGRRRLRRRVPRRRRLEHAARRLRRAGDGAAGARPARPHLRPARGRGRRPVGRLPGRRARRVRDPARAAGSATPTTPRSTASWPSSCRPDARAAAW